MSAPASYAQGADFWRGFKIKTLSKTIMSGGSAGTLQEILAEYAREAGGDPTRKLPPVDRWNPPDCGLSGIEIRRDGTWWHDGVRMTRESLVRLFATILRKDEDGSTWLVTPVERMSVDVADAHFLAIRADLVGEGDDQAIVFTTNMNETIAAGPDLPIRVTIDPITNEPRPYVLVRGRLEARILRAPFYEMVDWAQERDGVLRLRSQGAEFVLGSVQALGASA
jgi:uncharacterized protein